MISALLLSFSLVRAQDGLLPYMVHETDKISPNEHRLRRLKVLGSIPSGTVAVLFTNPERNRTNDTDFDFRPNSNFWYLTGCEEPDSALILSPDGITVDGRTVKEILFVMDRNPGQETWTGVKMGPPIAEKNLGFEMAVSNKRFGDVLGSLKPSAVMLHPLPAGATGALARMTDSFTKWKEGKSNGASLNRMLGEMRTTKSPAELTLMQHAIDVSVLAHTEAIKSCEPGMREYELKGLVEYIFTRNGCESVAYGSIVGSGMNSCVLHYVEDRKLIEKGDFLCMDVGAEYHGYAADVTRSFPATGKFSAEQRAIYEIVLKAQNAGIEACKVGAPFGASNAVVRKVIDDGLIALGITKTSRETPRYFPHGSSHYVGLDVHDPQVVTTLGPNQVLTVEPGIYIQPGSPCDKKWWNIGVRIEDDILVTPNGPVIMSGKLPRTIDEIERLMAKKGLGNNPVGKLPVGKGQ